MSRRQLRLLAFNDYFFPGVGGCWREVFWVSRDPDTLTKCLKVRWAEYRQLFRSLVAKAFSYGCVCSPSKLGKMMGISDYHLKVVLHGSCKLLLGNA